MYSLIHNLRVAKAELGEDEVRLAADIATLRFTTKDWKLESEQLLHRKKIHCLNFLGCSKKKGKSPQDDLNTDPCDFSQEVFNES